MTTTASKMASSTERNLKMAHNLADKIRTEDIQLKSESNIDFSGLLLSPLVLEGLKNAGFVRPSPIQLEAIPIGRCGADLIVQAKSGTGKTCVFAVVALESIKIDIRQVQVLVLAPTREIVVQVHEVVSSLSSAMPSFKCDYFIGGTPFAEDKIKIKKCQMAIGTPGRIQQLIQEKVLKTDAIRLFVLDEADKLLEESFQNSINWIYHKMPSSKQMLALSATYPESLAQLLAKYMQTPTFVRMNENNPALIGVKQFYKITEFHPLPTKSFENKIAHVLHVLSSLSFGQCIIFSNYQMRAQALCDRLNARGWPATYISGKKEQDERLKAISSLRQFKCRVLVSTDLTARGIDIENVNLVMNLDVPWDLETYLHRIGRAGRFGSHGIAITFASGGEEEILFRNTTTSGNLKVAQLPDKIGAHLWESVALNVDHEENGIDNFEANGVVSVEEVSQKTPLKPNVDRSSGHSRPVKDDNAPLSAMQIEVLKQDLNLKLETVGNLRKRDRDVSSAAGNVATVENSDVTFDDLERKETEIRYDNFEEEEKNLGDFLTASRKSCNVCLGAGFVMHPEKYLPGNDEDVRIIVNGWHKSIIDNVKNCGSKGDQTVMLDTLSEILDCLLENPDASVTSVAEYVSGNSDAVESEYSSELSESECTSGNPDSTESEDSEDYSSAESQALLHQFTEMKELSTAVKDCSLRRDEETLNLLEEDASTARPMLPTCHSSRPGHRYYEEWLRNLHTTKYTIWYSEYMRQMHRYRKQKNFEVR